MIDSESTLTIKWWGVILLVLGFFGWMTVSVLGQENRITRLETKLEVHLPIISSAMTNMNDLIKEVRQDQIRRQVKEH